MMKFGGNIVNNAYNNQCTYRYKNHFYHLQDGILTLRLKNLTCKYCCSFPDGDNKITDGDYIDITDSVLLPCDVFKIECNNNFNNITYTDYNFHIRRTDSGQNNRINSLENNDNSLKKSNKYDVYIYMVDSLSNFHAHRALNRTRKYLHENFEGFEMNYLNIQGNDILSNIYGLLLNKQNINVTDRFDERKKLINDWGSKIACNEYLALKTFILYLYKNNDYITLMADDSEYGGIFDLSKCKGFKKNIVDHLFRPFQKFLNQNEKRDFLLEKLKKKCQFYGFHIIEYLEKFLIRYKYRPKMAFLWQTVPMKNNMKDIFYCDKHFEEFFDNQSEYLNNSFLFFLGNHGYNDKDYDYTNMGSFEKKNPYFYMSIPFELRKNKKLMDNLEINSNKHISFMDIYATLLDILIGVTKNNFYNFDYHNHSKEVEFIVKGSSLLRPIPASKNRTCYDMYIPYQNCFCKTFFQKLPDTYSFEHYKLKKLFISKLNKKIEKSKCEIMTLVEKTFYANVTVSENDRIIYEVIATTLPGNVTFKALFNEDFELINENIIRLNSLDKKTTSCVSDKMKKQFCYCKGI